MCTTGPWPLPWEGLTRARVGSGHGGHPSWRPGTGPRGWPEDTQKGLEESDEQPGAGDEGRAGGWCGKRTGCPVEPRAES